MPDNHCEHNVQHSSPKGVGVHSADEIAAAFWVIHAGQDQALSTHWATLDGVSQGLTQQELPYPEQLPLK